jgi:hypothetical protein
MFVRTGSASTGFSAGLNVNGLNFIRVPSGGSTLGLTTALNTQARSWFFACRGTGASTYTYLIQATVYQSDSIYYESVSGNPILLEGPNSVNFSVGGYVSAAEQSVPSVFSFVVSAVTASSNVFTYDGQIRATPSEFNTIANAFNTGNITYSFGNGGFDFMEILFYSNDLLPKHRQQVEGYLGWKWGVKTSFPTTHPYYLNPPAIRLFKPSDLTSNVLWIDPSDLSTLTFRSGTSNVTYMADKSLNGYTGITSGTVPLCNSVIGGLPALYYASVYTNYISVSVSLPITSSNLSIFAVSVQSNYGSQSAAGRLLSFGSNGQYDFNSNLYGFIGNQGNTNLSPYRNGWKTGLSLTAGQPYVTSTIFDGTNVTMTSYGVSYAGSNATSAAGGGSFYINTFIIGAEPAPDGNAAWYGYIGEIIVYDRTLLLGERQLVEGYLARKWGVNGYLTTNHVSYNFRPYIVAPPYDDYLLTTFYSNTGSGPDLSGPLNAGGNGVNWGAIIQRAQPLNPIYFGNNNGVVINGNSNYQALTTGYVYSGTTTTIQFQVNTDDGIYLTFNGVNLINKYFPQGSSQYTSSSVTLPAGYSPIRITWYDSGGGGDYRVYFSIGGGSYISNGSGYFYHLSTANF